VRAIGAILADNLVEQQRRVRQEAKEASAKR
jgi:hypothetical protein